MKENRTFKSLHELAKYLVETGEFMLSLPDVSLDSLKTHQINYGINAQTQSKQQKSKQDNQKTAQNIQELAARLKQIEREEAEKQLSSLKYTELKEVAKYYNLPIGKRKNKKELIRRILWQLFDFKRGHQIIRDG
ncbi:MAG: hypothetical protein QXD24_01960 [Candidatus Caldarchaeum sp.]|jgi:hypothetical protein